MLMTTKKSTAIKTAAANAALQKPMGGGIVLKSVLIIDTGDGAFTDDSVKIKPHRTNPALQVWKCTDRARLVKALASAGITASITRGRKHFVAVVGVAAVAAALAAKPASHALKAVGAKLLK